MFRSFFTNRRWLHWSALGSAVILVVTWYKVQLRRPDQRMVRRLLRHPAKGAGRARGGGVPGLPRQVPDLRGNRRDLHHRRGPARILRPPLRLPLADRNERLLHVLLAPGAPHRRRGATRAGGHDALRRIVEGLGVAFMRSVMTLVAFLPLLWGLSEHVTELPWIGPVDHSLVYLAIISAAAGTVLLAVVGIKLPGLEFNNQKVEAAYRKELVYGEDHEDRAEPRRSPSCSRTFARTTFGSTSTTSTSISRSGPISSSGSSCPTS